MHNILLTMYPFCLHVKVRMAQCYLKALIIGIELLSRLNLKTPSRTQVTVDQLRQTAEQRLALNPPGTCPVDIVRNVLTLSHAQTCGKCPTCRIGLGQIAVLLDRILDGNAEMDVLELIENTAKTIVLTAECAIGVEAAKVALTGLEAFHDDFVEHIQNHTCLDGAQSPVPCVQLCPAHVDIPGYISLVREGRFSDAVRLMRKDNPLPLVCAYVCEHPCEHTCRRGWVDSPINIRGLKKFAVDHSGVVPQPSCASSTGKKIGVVGGGPGGLTVAYYLALMGHDVTIFEKRDKLGGMLRYGIPNFRLPHELLDKEIDSILSLGIQVVNNIDVSFDVLYDKLRQNYDAVYISMGAHTDKKLGIEGEEATGVMSAVQFLRRVGDGATPNFKGKNIVIVGGGNVAMDATRSSIRFGATKVTCIYRRRQEDMTALPLEVEGAIAEGAEVLSLHAPIRVEVDDSNNVVALWVQPQIIGPYDSAGRPRPLKANAPERRIPADVVIVAIGQNIETEGLQKAGIQLERWGTIIADAGTHVVNAEGVFSGGDCVTGPSTVIKAIAAGKVAAANIDEYLGFHHEISADIKLPAPHLYDISQCGRVNTISREASERKEDNECVEIGMTEQEAHYEASRCLRCDQFGFGIFRGGRQEKW